MAPLTETGIEVVFTPTSVDDDIRREGVLCMVEVRACVHRNVRVAHIIQIMSYHIYIPVTRVTLFFFLFHDVEIISNIYTHIYIHACT